MNLDKTILSEDLPLSTMIIVDEAKKRGIKHEIIVPRRVTRMFYGDHEEYFFYQGCDATGLVARGICHDKQITKTFLERSGISTPRGKSFSQNQSAEAFSLAEEIGWPVVLKPLAGGRGNYVFANVEKDKFYDTWDRIKSEDILLEEKISGKEYRIWATRDKVCGIVNRIPANVTGDGKSTVKQLIEEKNSDPMRGNKGEPKPLKKIKIDDLMVSSLLSKGYNMDSVLKDGQTLFLVDNSNLSTGGDSVDCYDQAHPSVFDIAIKAVKAIPGLAYVGMDFMTEDISKEQNPESYSIIELNDIPGLDGVHFPSIGTPRNAAKEIIDLAFPETREG